MKKNNFELRYLAQAKSGDDRARRGARRSKPLLLWLGLMSVLPAAAYAQQAAGPGTSSPDIWTISAPPSFQPPGEVSGGGPRSASPWSLWNYQLGWLAGWGSGGRSFANSRWAEDYSYLCNPAALQASGRKKNFFDPAKCVPFDPSGDMYVTFAGQERLKDYFEGQPFLGSPSHQPDNQSRNILRSMYSADVHISTFFRAYLELASSQSFQTTGLATQSLRLPGATKAGAIPANQRANLDVQQAFVEGKFQALGAQAGVMIGRQDYYDAPNVLLDTGDAVDIHTSWDGIRAYALWPNFRIDAFDYAAVKLVLGSFFQDFTNWQSRFSGVVTAIASPRFVFMQQPSQLFWETSYWDYRVNPSNIPFDPVPVSFPTEPSSYSADEEIKFYWVRLAGNAGPIVIDDTAVYQGGSAFNAIEEKSGINSVSPTNRTISAYSISTDTDYSFNDVMFAPLVGAQLNYYSGGDLRKDKGAIGTFQSPLASPSYFSLPNYIIPQNIYDIAPEVTLHVLPNLSVYLQDPIMWRSSLFDGVYGPGTIYNVPYGTGRYIGQMPLAHMDWQITHNIYLTENISKLFASAWMLKAGNADSLWIMSILNVRF
jgi:hypothetical protein